jgi:signal transduction histidine kinase/CheY-like chemotaxis protein
MTEQQQGAQPTGVFRTGSAPGFLLLALSLALPLVMLIAAAVYDRYAELRLARERVQAISITLAEHGRAVVQSADLVLARVSDRIQDMSWTQASGSEALHLFLTELRGGLPQVESIFLVNADGRIASSSRSFPAPAFYAREREYFAGAQDRTGLHISAPFRGQVRGTYAFTISRTLRRNGAFHGVVAVTVYPRYFEGFYRAVLDRPGASVAALVRENDGSVLVRYPELDSAPQRLPAESPLLKAAAGGALFGAFTGRSTMDGRRRISAFARLEGYPLLVYYGLDESEVLQSWNQHLAILAIFATLAGLALFLTARLTLAQASREQKNLQLLLAETRRRQEAESRLQHAQKMEALGRLTGGVAHDFNNLLAVILGGIEMASKRVEEPRASRMLAMAAEAAQRGAALTRQMLAFSRKQDIVLRPVDTNAVLTGMDELLSRTIGSLIRIRYDLAGDTWPIMADDVQLEVAILNLALNARDAMPLGGDLMLSSRNVTVAATSGQAAGLEPGDYVVIAVSDTGEGMPEHVRQRAFEPFFTTKEPSKGTGLGLSMVFGFATQAGGAAVIDSMPGRGTTVSLYMRRASALPEISDVERAESRTDEQPRLRILVVDDEDAVRCLAKEMLEEAGHSVTAVESGREALEQLASGRFDMLVADYAMPSMTGSQLAAEMRKLSPDLPILFMTGYVENDALKPWSELGYLTLSKPFTAAELTAAVQAVMAAPQTKVVPFRIAKLGGA